MIRRKSTLDVAQRIKKTRLVEIFSILDLCLQLPSDDRLLIRSQIKQGEQQLAERILKCKKDKNYHSLQIYLRKFVQKYKDDYKFGFSIKANSNRGKTPQTLKSTKNMTESSVHNSLQNSLQSSPRAKKPSRSIAISKLQIQKHIQYQINKQIKEGISKQQYQIPQRDVTPREMNPTESYLSPYQVQKPPQKILIQRKRKNNSISQIEQFNIKKMVKSKIGNDNVGNNGHQNKLRANPHSKIQFSNSEFKQNVAQIHEQSNQTFDMLKKGQNFPMKQPTIQRSKYGEFYKRIKQVIDQIS